ncbi:restriction endonuclease subunit S [Nitrosomonas communis]
MWKGDVLLVRSGQPGTAAIVPESLNGVNAIDILIATPEKSIVHPIYLCNYFNSAGGKRMAMGAQRGQIQKHLNVGELKVAPIPIPPLPLQHHFATIVESVEKQKMQMYAHLTELDALFASLQARAFNGEL